MGPAERNWSNAMAAALRIFPAIVVLCLKRISRFGVHASFRKIEKSRRASTREPPISCPSGATTRVKVTICPSPSPRSRSSTVSWHALMATRMPTSALISFFFSDFINRNWLVVCYAPCLLLPEIQVNDRLLTFFDNNEDASVSVSLRPSYDGVSSNGQRHNLGNFIGGETLVLDVFKGLSVDRVDGIRAVWKVQRVTIVEFVGGGIDLEISLWQLSSIIQIPWSYWAWRQRIILTSGLCDR